LTYHAEGLDRAVLDYFTLSNETKPDLSKWEQIVDTVQNPEGSVTIAVVGKYVSLLESYKSLVEALVHGGIANKTKVNIVWVDAEKLEQGDTSILHEVQAILVPGGFGERGTKGKIIAIEYARKSNTPFFGICFGMQMAVIETARNLCSLVDAHSSEINPQSQHNIVGLMTEWVKEDQLETRVNQGDMGGTMRLGAYPCVIKQGSLAEKIYGVSSISERHRHRYEVNLAYQELLEKAGLILSGFSPDGKLPEIIERPDHPFFIGVQFHPELKSKPFSPHPIFKAFVAAAIKNIE
jgi:CTP synthase